ncbi:hypothetical protein DDB_G0290605 [Dictyostelium discoideum AX4]|uniref:Uncharacterized protein n=1 Tax=Dictyostelium discoideum TaxID=44689 RepID=Q54FT1_DICDI|nr:hypothetical protein DDB_G0290605 [Dictyostelium discoideum AX4]EAL62163.1 hypothetical protein DDB_G0290605 [Dictyostelium discoideum AX4]|eukprot:XP_635686.1 hypothetical protein DDB_G0290605 [Dictyostelium discoideum AX4]
MITISEELENYSLSKFFEKCYYYLFKNWSTTTTTTTATTKTKLNKNKISKKNEKNHISHQTQYIKNDNNSLNNSNSNCCNSNNNDSNNNIKLKNEKEELINNNNNEKKTIYSLVGIEEAPEHLKREFILNGYRVDFSYLLCFKSVLIFGHNDFANIHSHLIPALFFMYTLWGVLTGSSGGYNDYATFDSGDKIVFTIFIGAAITTYILSFLYHTFGCHSLCTYSKLLVCDYLGIILLIGSSFFPPLYYSFKANHIGLMIFYMGSITMLCLLLAIMVLIPSLADKNTLRNTLFCLTALFGIVPSIHTLFIYPAQEVYYFIFRLVCMFLIYGAGLLVYIYRIPESLIPGYFDSIVTSHSVWHFFTAYATFFSLNTYLELYSKISNL